MVRSHFTQNACTSVCNFQTPLTNIFSNQTDENQHLAGSQSFECEYIMVCSSFTSPQEHTYLARSTPVYFETRSGNSTSKWKLAVTAYTWKPKAVPLSCCHHRATEERVPAIESVYAGLLFDSSILIEAGLYVPDRDVSRRSTYSIKYSVTWLFWNFPSSEFSTQDIGCQIPCLLYDSSMSIMP